MLSAHSKKKTYEDFYKEKMAEIISLYKSKMNLWLGDLINVTKVNEEVKEKLNNSIIHNKQIEDECDKLENELNDVNLKKDNIVNEYENFKDKTNEMQDNMRIENEQFQIISKNDLNIIVSDYEHKFVALEND